MSVELTVRGPTVYVGPLSDEVREHLQAATSFKRKDLQYAVPHAVHVRLLRNSQCPVGLLDRLCRTLRQQGEEPRVVFADEWQRPKDHLALRLMDLGLRNYQQQVQLAADLYNRGVIKAPTGSGKTAMGAAIIQVKAVPALVVVPTIDLLYQYKDYLAMHLIPAPGVAYPSNERWRIGQLGDGTVDPQPVTVATIRTMAKVLGIAYETYEYAEYDDSDDTMLNPQALRWWVESLGTVVVDEAHILGAHMVYQVVTKIPALYKYGMSASPWRDDGADLMIEAATGPLICRVPTRRLVRQGYLMAPLIQSKDTRGWWTPAAWGRICIRCKRQWLQWTTQCSCGGTQFRSQFNDCYRQEIVENAVRNAKIAEMVKQLDRPTMVLVKQVKHGRALQKLIPKSVFLSGRAKGGDRTAAYAQLRAGQLSVLICTVIGDMGLDLPNLEALVLAGGGKSSTRHLQRIGRVVRPSPGKRQPVVVDFDDGHVHGWFRKHAEARRKIERAEWSGVAQWQQI